TFHRIAVQGLASEPTPWLLSVTDPLMADTVWFHEFYLNPHSLEDSAERMLSWGELDVPPIARFDQVTYVPLTDCAANDPQFQRVVGEKIASTYFDPTACLLIRVPAGTAELTERIRFTLEGIR